MPNKKIKERSSAKKKYLSILVATVVIVTACLAGFSVQATAAPIRVIINGRPIITEVPPVVQNGRTLVPFRAIFEALGAEVNWNERTNTVAGYRGPSFVLLEPGSTRAFITGREIRREHRRRTLPCCAHCGPDGRGVQVLPPSASGRSTATPCSTRCGLQLRSSCRL